jgi:Fe-S oxidoreductase
MTPVCGDGWDLPEVGVATLGLLERLGRSVEYPLEQTCCGQTMANSGCQEDSAATKVRRPVRNGSAAYGLRRLSAQSYS